MTGHFTHSLIMALTEQGMHGTHTHRVQDSIRTLAYGALAEIEAPEPDPTLHADLVAYVREQARLDSPGALALVSRLPVDPDLVKAREWYAATWPGKESYRAEILSGERDGEPQVVAYLVGLRAGKGC